MLEITIYLNKPVKTPSSPVKKNNGITQSVANSKNSQKKDKFLELNINVEKQTTPTTPNNLITNPRISLTNGPQKRIEFYKL